MNDNIISLPTRSKIFCSHASGQIWSLDDNQIERVPYLSALISSAGCFQSIRDENGYYKLDPWIQSTYFSFIVDSISFHSIRQLFTHLPKQYDVIAIVALCDFLGIAPHPNPTFEEIDSAFFSSLTYKPSINDYVQIIRPVEMQDMAVRFAFALVKEEYDFARRDVMDQIYWFIMFIESAYELFGPRLRHHIYRIAEHCFALFSRDLLEPLGRLIQPADKGMITVLTSIDVDLCCYEKDEQIPSINIYREHPLFLGQVEFLCDSSSFFYQQFYPWP
ncbi:unnamed protein product [Adineta ricciae]|uniref:Uncharacterized protein n=1 Tax=Adineta ricciae TaxID=249248 RepID=A0A815W8D1_ADIRI|nr:unnamed protein product [Adineta ricciae]CAF1538789.1 unnamed protein product [Adineta ricciae]